MQIKVAAIMRTMVLTIAAAVAIAGLGDAQASSTSSSHSSTSFKSGFSSQKKSSSKKSAYDFGNSAGSSDSSAASPAKKTGFGSFSKSSEAASAPTSDAAAPRSKSLFSKDLDQNAANANALKTLDARNAARESRDNPAYSQQSAAGTPLYPAGAQQAPAAAPPVIIQNNGGGSSNGWMWFLLGQSMHSRDRVIIERGNSSGNSSGNTGGATGQPGATAGTDNTGNAGNTGTSQQPGFFMHTVRILFWLLVLAAVGGGIYYLAKRKGISKSANYTLGKF